jgi:creatinine amidohydrolase/Fe(II)-dependent formamide hydrolase-like protein
MKPFHELIPDEIISSRNKSGCAFVPVGPIEWHSYHLPVGTDALIAERICELVAERVGGVYFKPLFLGTDALRNENELLSWGFKKEDKIFGMNFPDLPLVSEYCSMEDLKSNVTRRLKFLRESKFKVTFIVNHHGGLGQNEYLKEVCSSYNLDNFKVEFVPSYRFLNLEDKSLDSNCGGHAGISESTFLLAFRPDLIDLTKVPAGELFVKEMGILHYHPVIEEKYNPGNISKTLADELRKNIIKNFVNYVLSKH